MKMIAIIILTAVTFTATAHSSMAATQNCEFYKNRINRLQSLNARGGKAKQLDSRRKQINHYENELYKCSNIQKIFIVTNNQQHNPKPRRQKLRSIKIQNPQLQQLIKTCNYWIQQNNKHSSWDNTNFRDTACRAADESEDAIDSPTPRIVPNARKLKDCIKPNKLIDNDVNECMKGNKEPNWKK